MNRISVITVTRNDLDGVIKTQQSVVSQSILPLEHIIWDAGSDSPSIANIVTDLEFSKVILAGPDRGVYDGMNMSLQSVVGDWILFLNSGDTLADDYVIETLTSIDAENCSIVYGDNLIAYECGFVRQRYAQRVGDFKRGLPFSHQAVLASRKLLMENPFDVGKINSDYAFFLQLFIDGYSFKKIPIVISTVLAGGLSDRKRMKKIYQDYELLKSLELNTYLDLMYCWIAMIRELFKSTFKFILPACVLRAIYRFRAS